MKTYITAVLSNPELMARVKESGIKFNKEFTKGMTQTDYSKLKTVVDNYADEMAKMSQKASADAAWRASDAFKVQLQKAFEDKAFMAGSFKELQEQFGGINFAELKPVSFDSLREMGRKFSSTFTQGVTEEGQGFGAALSGALTAALSNSPISLEGLKTVKEWWDKVWDYASSVIEQINDKLKDIGTTIGSTMLGSISTAYSTVANTIKDIGTRAASAFYEAMRAGYTKVFEMVKDLSTRAATMMYEAIRDAYAKVAEVVKDVGQSQITNAAKSLGIDLGAGIDQGLTSVDLAFGQVLGNIITNIVGTLNSDLNGAISRFDTMENFPRIMANMGIEASESTSNINRMADAIDGLPTALNDMTTFTEKIFPMFNKNLGDATTFAIAFNNALVADGKSIGQQSQAMEQMSQMLGNSKVDMLSWRSVVEAMPTSMNQLAEYFHAGSPQELYNMLPGSKGAAENGVKVTLEELTDAFVKLNEEGLNGYTSYAERAQTATFGVGTAIKNLHNRVERALQAVMEFIGQEKIAGFINNLTKKFVPSVTQAVGLIDRIGVKDNIAKITDTLNVGVDKFIQKLGPIQAKLEPFLSGALNVATQAISSTINHVIDRAGPFIDRVADKMGQFVDNASEITNLIQPVIDSFIDLKFTTFESAMDMWQKVITAVAPVLPSMIGSFSKITATVASFIGNISDDIAPVADDIFGALADGVENAEPKLERIVSALAPIVGTMATQIINVASTIVGVVDNVLQLTNSDGVPYLVNIVNNIGTAASSIIASLSPFVSTILSTISDLSDVLLPIITRIVDTLAPIAMQIITTVSDGIMNIAPTIESIITSLAPIIETMVGQVATIAEKITSIVAEVFGLTNEDGLPLIQGMIDNIGNTMTSVIDAIAPYIPSLVESVTQIVDALSPLITELAATLAPIASEIIDKLADGIAYMSPFIERIITALAPVVQIMAEQLVGIAEIVARVLADTLELTDENGVPLLQHIVGVIGSTIMDILNLLAPHIPHLMEAIVKIVDALAPAVEEIFKAMEPYIDELVDMIVYAAQQLAPAIAEIFTEYIAPNMPAIMAVIKDLIDFAVTHMKSIVEQVLIIMTKFEPLWANMQRLTDEWMPAILKVAGEVATVFLNPLADAAATFSGWLDSLPKIDLRGLTAPTQAFATGGIVTQPTRAIIGEAGVPEAVVPLSAAGIAKFTSGLDKRYQNGGTPSINVNIGTFVNNDTATDVNSLCDQIGKTSLRKLREQGVAA
jgi:tape measure domain-containing protein